MGGVFRRRDEAEFSEEPGGEHPKERGGRWGEEKTDWPKPIADPAELERDQAREVIGGAGFFVDDREQQQGRVDHTERDEEAEQRKEKHTREKIAAERKDDGGEV